MGGPAWVWSGGGCLQFPFFFLLPSFILRWGGLVGLLRLDGPSFLFFFFFVSFLLAVFVSCSSLLVACNRPCAIRLDFGSCDEERVFTFCAWRRRVTSLDISYSLRKPTGRVLLTEKSSTGAAHSSPSRTLSLWNFRTFLNTYYPLQWLPKSRSFSRPRRGSTHRSGRLFPAALAALLPS